MGGEGTPCSPVTAPSQYILDKGLDVMLQLVCQERPRSRK